MKKFGIVGLSVIYMFLACAPINVYAESDIKSPLLQEIPAEEIQIAQIQEDVNKFENLFYQKTVQNEELVVNAPTDSVKESTLEPLITDEELNTLCKIVWAEARGESELGKRLVIDTVLNRVDNEQFPDDIVSVCLQRSQFSCVGNGSYDKAPVEDEIRELVLEELQERTDYNVIYFTAGHYSDYGEPYLIEDHHYFSK